MPQTVSGVLHYRCIRCGKEVTKGIMPVHQRGVSKNMFDFIRHMFDEKLCEDCYTDTETAISGAAEKIMTQLH